MTTDAEVLTELARERLARLRYVGEFDDQQASERGCRLIATEHGKDDSLDQVRLCWLVDDEGFIRHARYRTMATGLTLLAIDIAAELCIGVTVDMAGAVTPEHVRQQLRLVYGVEGGELPWESGRPIAVLVKAANRWKGIVTEEREAKAAARGDSVPGQDWDNIGLFEKVRRIESVLDEHVRPMLAADGGGMDLVDLRESELVVEYHGACGSCSSSIGGTLFFIEDSLEEHLGVRLTLQVQGLERETPIDL